MIRIKRKKKDQFFLGEGWVVWDTEANSGDLVPTFWDAIKYALWYMGVPFRWLYRKTNNK